MALPEISDELIESTFQRLKKEAEASGYRLHPDISFVKDLIRGILVNEKRYGYWGCPCRLSARDRKKDLDIICPCDYRDPDLNEFGQCYCGLYVSENVFQGKKEAKSIPERRAVLGSTGTELKNKVIGDLPLPIWRCKVCGYLCARPEAPLKCPICKADQDRFERFI